MTQLTAQLFNSFCNNILGIQERALLHKDHHPEYIVAAYKDLQSEVGETWHIQCIEGHYVLWRRKAWLTDIEHQKHLNESRAYFNEVLDERKQTFKDICLAICETMDLESEMATSPMIVKVAEKIMKRKSDKAGLVLGIDLTNLRELPSKVAIINPVTGKVDYVV